MDLFPRTTMSMSGMSMSAMSMSAIYMSTVSMSPVSWVGDTAWHWFGLVYNQWSYVFVVAFVTFFRFGAIWYKYWKHTHLIQNRARQYFCKNCHACTSVNVNCIKRPSETPWRRLLTCYCRCLLSVWRQLSKQIPSALPIQIQILSKKERTCKFRLSI